MKRDGETGAAHCDVMGACVAPGEIENIMHDDIFKSHMRADAIRGMDRFIVEAVEID